MFDSLSEKLSGAFQNLKGKGKITEANIEDTIKLVRTALLEADVNFKVVRSLIKVVREKSIGEKVTLGVDPGEQFIKIIHDELAKIMGGEHENINFNRSKLLPVLVVGLNGSGKTTFSGKLSLYLRKNEKKDIFLIPADTFRPAAKDQLMVLAKNMGIDCFDSDLSMHPKDVALAGIEEAKRLNKNIVIIDTAGRLHVDDELMGELKELKSAISNLDPEVLFVADAMTGQEAVNVAKSFNEAVGLTGVVLSKMDSDSRGGAALSIKSVTGIPIRYISVGEKMKDLEFFHPDRLAKRILDMGDVLTLVEKAEEAISEKEAEKMLKKLEKNRFTIEDFLKQINSMNKLGSMSSLLKMLPGMGSVMRNIGDLSPAEDEIKKIKIIISSMTTAERQDDTLLKVESRKKRIAKGSGTSVLEINKFINKFNQMRQMMGGVMGMMKNGDMGGMEDLFGEGGGMPGQAPQRGFRQTPGNKQKMKKRGKGKGRGPWGGGYF